MLQSRTWNLRPLLRMLACPRPLVKGNEDARYEGANAAQRRFVFVECYVVKLP